MFPIILRLGLIFASFKMFSVNVPQYQYLLFCSLFGFSQLAHWYLRCYTNICVKKINLECCSNVGKSVPSMLASHTGFWFRSQLCLLHCSLLLTTWEQQQKMAPMLGPLPPTWLGRAGVWPEAEWESRKIIWALCSQECLQSPAGITPTLLQPITMNALPWAEGHSLQAQNQGAVAFPQHPHPKCINAQDCIPWAAISIP